MSNQGELAVDDPAEVAAEVARLPRPLLVGLDVDGVLAPLVDHADDAHLLDGMGDAVAALARATGVHVAVVSGRAVDDLARFAFDDGVEVIGSHGMESRSTGMDPLDEREAKVLAELDALARDAATSAGDGAWVERKPASVVLHVRQADPDRGARSLVELHSAATAVHGATVKDGSNVLELFARHADKGSALMALHARLAAGAVVFVGDDLTDEEAFARLRVSDLAIKVGAADTIATRRLADPPAVLRWLTALHSAIS